jgi:hypothetical protein
MPLTKRQFELGIDEEGEELMRLVYRLLDDNRDLAYSTEEIQATVVGAGVTAAANSAKFFRALEVLAEIGAVDKGDVDRTDYYAFLQDFDTGTWYSAKHAPSAPYS